MEEFLKAKYPTEFNKIQSMVGDLFHPYTAVPHYDEIIYDKPYTSSKMRYGKIVEMSPDKYIDEAYKGFTGEAKTYGAPEFPKERMIKGRLADTSYPKIKAMIKNNEKLWMPYLNYGKNSSFSQEGLHRALALKELGIKKMPVLVASEGVKDGLKNVMSKATRFGKVLYGLPLNELGLIPEYAPLFDVILTKKKENKMQKLQKLLDGTGAKVMPNGNIQYEI